MPTLLLDRPVVGDPILLHAFARRRRPLSVGELLRAMSGTGARISDVMELLTDAVAAGLLTGRFRTDDSGRPIGARLYELTNPGREAVAADRIQIR
jgi:hypothetical protein